MMHFGSKSLVTLTFDLVSFQSQRYTFFCETCAPNMNTIAFHFESAAWTDRRIKMHNVVKVM